MASSTILVKLESSTNAWFPGMTLLRHEAGGTGQARRSKASSGRGPIPAISICSPPSNRAIDASNPRNVAKDEKSSPAEQRITRQTSTNTQTNSSDERGRSLLVAQKDSALSYQSLQRTFQIDIDGKTTTCIANSTKGKKGQTLKCKNRVSKASLSEARKVLGIIASTADPRTRSQHLIKLAELLVCKNTYHQVKALSFAQSWEAEITPLSERRIFLAPMAAAPKAAATGRRAVSAPVAAAPKAAATGRRAVSAPVATAPKIVLSPSISEVSTDSDKFDTSNICIRTFVPFDARAKSQGDTSDFVRGAIEKDLTPNETKTGYIYIYWFPGNFGHLKLGCTTRTVEVRLREWERQCGHKVFQVVGADQEPMPHVHRVENILKAQLRNCRRKETRCLGCGKCHQEWFEQAQQEAIDSVQKWADWIRTNPYKEVSPGVWKLKKCQKGNLEALCKSPPTPPEIRARRASTPSRMEKNQRNGRRASVLPVSLRRTVSAEPPRRSARLAERRRKSIPGDGTSNPTYNWEFKVELKA
ncbi:MAG: hypothetical protein LQ346_007641 [Caloplaca aetnensis]|nr:MAG: hypothetical protein LQ346_007641 [Caloplaca aetnensis]